MATLPETELEQKTTEFMAYVRDYALNKKKDFILRGQREKFHLSVFDKDVTLDFIL